MFQAIFNLMNRLVDGFELERGEREQLSSMAKMINSQGYQAVIQSAE